MGSFHDWIVNEWIWWVNQHLVIVFIFHLLRFGTVNDSTISWDRAKITYHIKCDMYHITGTGLCSSPVYCTVQWYECCLAFGFFIAEPMDPNFCKFHSHKAPLREGSVHSIKKKKSLHPSENDSPNQCQTKKIHEVKQRVWCENPPKFEWVRKGTFQAEWSEREESVTYRLIRNNQMEV